MLLACYLTIYINEEVMQNSESNMNTVLALVVIGFHAFALLVHTSEVDRR